MDAIQWRTRYGLREAEERATAPSVASPRAEDRRYGPGRESTPRRPTGTEHGQGQGGGARDELHGYAPDDAPPRAASMLYFSLDDDVGGACRPA